MLCSAIASIGAIFNDRICLHRCCLHRCQGYYQEIGRAGRDGKPSRAILLYSFADRRTHEFFHGRDYPEVKALEMIYRALTAEKQPAEVLARRLDLDEETFHKALEKLWIHGGAEVDPEESAARGDAGWKQPYMAQRNHKLFQLEQITNFAQCRDCRMLHMVHHFGDQEDSGEPCGLCDICAAGTCLVRRFRHPDDREIDTMRRVIAALEEWDNQGTGQLFKKTCEGTPVDRGTFERVLSGLAQAELIRTREDAFEKDGRTIRFQRAGLMPQASDIRPGQLASIMLTEEPKKPKRKAKKKRKSARGATRKTTTRKTATRKTATRKTARGATRKSAPRRAAAPPPAPLTGHAAGLYEALKAWRLAEAKRRRVPAFRIMSNRTLGEIVAARPTGEAELVAVRGIGPTLMKKYGRKLLEIVAAGGLT